MAEMTTTSTTISLPVIDLSLLDNNNNDPDIEVKILKQWNDAFSQYGFCYLSSQSHGLSLQFQRVEMAALQFFTTLTPQEKSVYYLNKGYGHGGYVAPGIERVTASLINNSDNNNNNNSGKSQQPSAPDADPVESLCVHSIKAEHVPPFLLQDFNLQKEQNGNMDNIIDDYFVPYKYGLEFKHAVQELWQGLETLLMRIMTISAKALQLPNSRDYFHNAFSPGANFMRLAHYVDTTTNSDSDDNNSDNDDNNTSHPHRLRYGVHTDYSGFTFLWRNQSNGLQCAADMRQIIDTNNNKATTQQQQPQSWINVPILENDPHALVINAGDLIQRWTNDYWVSNLHRVVAVTDADVDHDTNTTTTTKEPLSIVFFTGPNLDTKINVLPSPLFTHDPESNKYKETITAGEHLFQKLARTSM